MLVCTQQDGYTCRSTDPDKHTEGLDKDQDREGERKSRDSKFTDALSDEDTIHHAVERIDHRPYDGRDTIVKEELWDTFVR